MQKDTENGAGSGYEERDVDVRAIFRPVMALAVVTVVTFVLMYWVFELLAWRETFYDPPPSAVPRARELPPGPRLQQSPPADLRAMRAAEERTLTSYGLVDEKTGVVRIPIERAMKLLVERGLPERSGGGR